MNIMIWIFGRGIAGWIGYSYVKFNQDRGMMLSMVVALASAAACLTVGNLVSERYGV